ncbi:MAG: hypothetical protein ACLSAC_09595 [Enterocloster bolteae]
MLVAASPCRTCGLFVVGFCSFIGCSAGVKPGLRLCFGMCEPTCRISGIHVEQYERKEMKAMEANNENPIIQLVGLGKQFQTIGRPGHCAWRTSI